MVKNSTLNLPTTIFTYLQAVAQRFPIERAYLFGSYSLGSENEESDIDIAIISSAFAGNHFVDDVQLGLVKLSIDRRISPIGFRPEMFNDNDMLAEEILRTGQELPLPMSH
jgi:predicted nucleotidyltransferase